MDLSRTTDFCPELQKKIAQISAVQNTELGLRMYKFQLTMQWGKKVHLRRQPEARFFHFAMWAMNLKLNFHV